MRKLVLGLSFEQAFTLAAGVLARLGWALVFGVFLTTLISSMARAEGSGLQLYSWQPFEDSAAFVIPVRAGESAEQASSAYLAALRANEDLAHLFDHAYPNLDLVRFSKIDQSSFSEQALLLANRESDFKPRALRIVKFARAFATTGLKTYVLPISADLNLNGEEAAEFRSLVAESFGLMIAMGGHDVDSHFYHVKDRAFTSKTETRDRSEIEMIKTYVAMEKGFLFATCRGLQVTSVALGYKLVQDIPKEVGASVSHQKTWHEIALEPTMNSILLGASSGRKTAVVNSLHHQSAQLKAGGPLEVAGRAEDGVVEALEFKNGRGLLVQFHPEFMISAFAKRILAKVAAAGATPRRAQRTCSALFQ